MKRFLGDIALDPHACGAMEDIDVYVVCWSGGKHRGHRLIERFSSTCATMFGHIPPLLIMHHITF